MEVKKLSEHSWKIPKTDSMKVPGTIYASEKLLEQIKKDKTLEQIRNVASLKGIQRASYAMPDAHQGYGFPIGGVAAFDIDTGIVSPGGVGYDINCLPGDSEVLHELGYYRKIEDMESAFTEIPITSGGFQVKSFLSTECLLTLDRHTGITRKPACFFMKKKHTGKIITIKTKNGRIIRATPEHPILTPQGMMEAALLAPGLNAAVHPFKGVMYDGSPKPFLESIFTKSIEYSDEKAGIIARIFGYILGDGNIYFTGKKGRVCAYGKEHDLKIMQEDFRRLGFSARIYNRERAHSITTQYGTKDFRSSTCQLHVSSTELSTLFIALGYPQGKKASSSYLVPDWIMNGPQWMKRLFLSGFFGAELSSPRCHTKTGFDCPVLSQNKNEFQLENGRLFMIQVMGLLESFGVMANKISSRGEYENKQGKTCRIRLLISSDEENLIRLYSNVGFSYNAERELKSFIAVQYMLEKKRLTKDRENIASEIKRLRHIGLTIGEVKGQIKGVNERFIERHYYENAGNRIPVDFPSFEKYSKAKQGEYLEHSVFFDEIESINSSSYDGFVYDLNIEDTHNFIANGIIVSNCGVRMLRTGFLADDISKKSKELLDALFKDVPAGVGEAGQTKVSKDELMEAMAKGAKWAIDKGYGTKDDALRTEESGTMPGADPHTVSDRAMKRGMPQLGTLGSGNHFLEIQKVDKIFDPIVAKAFGIKKEGQVTIMIHCGSRGLGHQVASDYIKDMEDKYGYKDLPERELVNAPINSDLGQRYMKAMACAINFAFINRQMIEHWTRGVFERVMGTSDGMEQVYDVCHNLAKYEKHMIDGKMRQVVVHRKGATRSFGPGREEIPEAYRNVGQPVLIPGSMGTASYILVGTKKAEEVSFGSTAHGAGRVMSRHEAINKFSGEQIKTELAKRGITIKGASNKGIAEEASAAYKDVDEVVRVSHAAGIGNLVARVVPVAVMKG
jgi:tRNA-splicing ligase RtcB